MNVPEHATPANLILLALIIGSVLYFIRSVRRGREVYIRRIAGIDAIDEAIGRSAELGRPLSFSTGLSGIGPVLYASLGVLYYIARKASLLRSRLFLPQNDPQVLPIVEETARAAYRAEGRGASFDPSNVRYLSDEQFAFASGYMGLIQRENVASTFLFGRFAAESLVMAEAGQQIGAMQVAASYTPEQVPFFITTCDYTLIGEELYAASAYLTHEPVLLGSIRGQDIAKVIFLCLIIVGVAIATYNSVYSAKVMNLEYYFTLSWSDLLQP